MYFKKAPFDFNNDKEADDRCWWMPISFITKQSPKIESVAPKYWFGCKEDLEITDIKLEKDDWIILNPRLTGKKWIIIFNLVLYACILP